jgi:hypothetical protein
VVRKWGGVLGFSALTILNSTNYKISIDLRITKLLIEKNQLNDSFAMQY